MIRLRELSAFRLDMDRKRAAPLVLAAAAAVVLVFGGVWVQKRYAAVKRLATARKADLAAFAELRGEYLALKASIDWKMRKAYAGGAAGASSIAELEDIAARAGVRDRISTLRTTGMEEELGYASEGVEMKVERLDLNGLVNLLYLIENGRGLFIVRGFTVKSRFQEPDLVDLTIDLRHITRTGG